MPSTRCTTGPTCRSVTRRLRPGPIMAAADRFDIVLRGRGGHAAQPHRTPDVLLAASQLVVQLNTIVSRRIDPAESAVLSVTRMAGGVSHNVLPAEADSHWHGAQLRRRSAGSNRGRVAGRRGRRRAHAWRATLKSTTSATILRPSTRAAEAQIALYAAEAAGLRASVAPRPAFDVRGLRVPAAKAAGRLPVARPRTCRIGGACGATAAPSLLRLQRRRAAVRRSLVLRGRRTSACSSQACQWIGTCRRRLFRRCRRRARLIHDCRGPGTIARSDSASS